jgi:hypothetical protein
MFVKSIKSCLGSSVIDEFLGESLCNQKSFELSSVS